MTISKHTLARSLGWWSQGLLLLPLGCKDESPCDEGQVERDAVCYVVGAGGGAGGSGTAGGGPGSGGADGVDTGGAGGIDGGVGADSGPAPAEVDAEVGQPCADTVASSDCGGEAPICAPLPSGTVCTQILCQPGEPNAGACPSGWTCRQIGANPSVCLNF